MGKVEFRTQNRFRDRHKKVTRSTEKDKEQETLEVLSGVQQSSSARIMVLLNIDLEEKEDQHKDTLESCDCFLLCEKEAISKLLRAVSCSKCFVPGLATLLVVVGGQWAFQHDRSWFVSPAMKV